MQTLSDAMRSAYLSRNKAPMGGWLAEAVTARQAVRTTRVISCMTCGCKVQHVYTQLEQITGKDGKRLW